MRRGYTEIDLITKIAIDPPVSLTLRTLEETFNNTNPCMERILSELKPGSMVLEIGCSYGINTFQLAKQGIKVVANDTDANALSDFLNFSSYRCYDDNVSINYGKFPTETYFPSGYFDAVTMYHILYHMNPYEIRDCFKEIHKILKPGGKVYITTPTPYSSDYYWYTFSSLQRHLKKKKWPGEIKDRQGMWSKVTGHPQEFDSTPALPSYSHPQFPSILSREAELSGMIVLQKGYYPYNSERLQNNLPQNLNLEGVISYRKGKEGAYLIAQKPQLIQ
jgi:SAM-dependent methyltransferase